MADDSRPRDASISAYDTTSCESPAPLARPVARVSTTAFSRTEAPRARRPSRGQRAHPVPHGGVDVPGADVAQRGGSAPPAGETTGENAREGTPILRGSVRAQNRQRLAPLGQRTGLDEAPRDRPRRSRTRRACTGADVAAMCARESPPRVRRRPRARGRGRPRGARRRRTRRRRRGSRRRRARAGPRRRRRP